MGFSAIICYFHAVKYIPVGDVSVIGSMQMVTVALCAHVTLGEKCGVVPALAAVVTLAGIAFIAKPPILTGQDEYDVNTLVLNLSSSSNQVGMRVSNIFVVFLDRDKLCGRSGPFRLSGGHIFKKIENIKRDNCRPSGRSGSAGGKWGRCSYLGRI